MNHLDQDDDNSCRIEDDDDKEEEGLRVREFLKKEIDGWDDPVKATAWFKGFSGQRCDWEGRYLFWRDLILKVARHLRTFIIRPSRLKNIWFRRDGALSPLCLDRVLLEMYNAGDLLRSSDLMDPRRSGRLSFILWKAVHVLGFSRPSALDHFTEDYYILSTLLKEKALEVLKLVSENHWTSSCVITMRNFLEICGGQEESSALLSYLSGGGKAKYLVINKKDVIENGNFDEVLIKLKNTKYEHHVKLLLLWHGFQGVKVSLSPGAVSDATSLDYDLLHLIWTVEKLQQQLDIIDHRCQKSKTCALASLNSGNKQAALRHARELKLTSQSREKCTILLNRVEEVLRVIADAESTQKVSEAIKVGAQAIKENEISVEELEQCLQELDVGIKSVKQVDEVLGSIPACAAIEDEDVEDELKMLELEIGAGPFQSPNGKSDGDCLVRVIEASQTADSLGENFSNLSLKESAATKAARKSIVELTSDVSNDVNLECA